MSGIYHDLTCLCGELYETSVIYNNENKFEPVAAEVIVLEKFEAVLHQEVIFWIFVISTLGFLICV